MNTSGFFSVFFYRKKNRSFLEFIRQCFFRHCWFCGCFAAGFFFTKCDNDTHHEVDNMLGCWPNIVGVGLDFIGWWGGKCRGDVMTWIPAASPSNITHFCESENVREKSQQSNNFGLFSTFFYFYLSSRHLMWINSKPEFRLTNKNDNEKRRIAFPSQLKTHSSNQIKKNYSQNPFHRHHCFGPSTTTEWTSHDDGSFFFVTAIAIAVVPNILLSEKNKNSQPSATHTQKIKKKLFNLIVMVSPSSSSAIQMTGYWVCWGKRAQHHHQKSRK